MRKAINENPVAQAAVIGLLVIAVAFLLLTRVVNSSNSGGSEPATDSSAAPVASDATAPAPSVAAPSAPSDVTASGAPAGEFVAGPGLPESVVSAYDDGEAVVLLVTRKAGIEDQRLKAMVGSARGVGKVAVFTTNARGIGRYSRIARGVDVSRVPALVVVRPRNLSSGVPEATVSYGFRGPESVEQAVRDALYDGKSNLPYYPE